LCAAYSLCKTAAAAEQILKKNNRFILRFLSFSATAADALLISQIYQMEFICQSHPPGRNLSFFFFIPGDHSAAKKERNALCSNERNWFSIYITHYSRACFSTGKLII